MNNASTWRDNWKCYTSKEKPFQESDKKEPDRCWELEDYYVSKCHREHRAWGGGAADKTGRLPSVSAIKEARCVQDVEDALKSLPKNYRNVLRWCYSEKRSKSHKENEAMLRDEKGANRDNKLCVYRGPAVRAIAKLITILGDDFTKDDHKAVAELVSDAHTAYLKARAVNDAEAAKYHEARAKADAAEFHEQAKSKRMGKILAVVSAPLQAVVNAVRDLWRMTAKLEGE